VPSEIHVGIMRDRFDSEHEVAVETANAVRDEVTRYVTNAARAALGGGGADGGKDE
jgi:hypothetical protein